MEMYGHGKRQLKFDDELVTEAEKCWLGVDFRKDPREFRGPRIPA